MQRGLPAMHSAFSFFAHKVFVSVEIFVSLLQKEKDIKDAFQMEI
jgi:hypothetical protein